MNNTEKMILDALLDLKNNHQVTSIKCEFETEGTSFDEAVRLKSFASSAGLDLSVKIGGCEAIKDMIEAKIIGANTIVAPMIESPYALQKFVNASKQVFCEKEIENTNFFINIETITGFEKSDSIFNSPYCAFIDGVILGRSDMAGSLEIRKEEINSDKMFEIANILSEKVFKKDKIFGLGGGISCNAIPFLKSLNQNHLSIFETRKVVFDAPKALADSNISEGIVKAIKFEIMWLKNKNGICKSGFQRDKKRIEMLENSIRTFV